MTEFIIVLIILTILIFIENKNLKTTNFYIKSDKLGKSFDNTKIVVLADLHNNLFGKENKRLIKSIDKINPEIILIAGDMIVSKNNKNFDITINLLKDLTKKYPIYYSNGNHEERIKDKVLVYGDRYEEYFSKLKEIGIIHLSNETIYLQKKEEKIVITGLEIGMDYYRRGDLLPLTKEYLKDKIGSSNKECYQILIAHNPLYFEEYAKWGADLTVSGHIHGGIMILPFLGGVVSPQVRFFPKYYGGQFSIDEKQMIVSCGLGLHTIKIRLFNRPEVVVINLKSV